VTGDPRPGQERPRSGPDRRTYAAGAVRGSDDLRPGGLAQLGQLLRAVRRRAALVAVIIAAAGITAFVLTIRQEPSYEAVSQVWISQSDPVSALLTRTDARPADPERDFNTRVQLIAQPAVARRVRRQLGLRVSTDALLGSVSTETRGTSDIVDIHAVDSDPRRAAAIANGFARQFVAEREDAARATILHAADRAARELEGLSAVERGQSVSSDLARRVRTLQIEAGLQTTGIEVVRLASPPAAAASRHVLALTVLAMTLAGLVAVALAAVLDVVDRRIVDEADLEAFDAPLLAAVPAARPGAGTDDATVREALAAAATTLRPRIEAQELGSILVTSAGPGDDGRAAVSIGVAAALAQLGMSVVVIEADLRQPAFAERLNLPDGPGLGDVLAGDAELDEAVVDIDAHTLRRLGPDEIDESTSFAVVPAGAPVPNPLALLGAPAMRRVLKRARGMADVVVVDAPPVGSAGDALTLAGSVDGVLLVVRRGHARRDAVAQAMRALAGVPTPVLGVVLTGAPRPAREAARRSPAAARSSA
jgi:succinoglycan biosynthesis transport protein ExoP